MRLLPVIRLLFLGRHLVTVDQWPMVVLVAVVTGAVLELAERTARVVMRDVIVIVPVHLGRVGVFLLLSLFSHGVLIGDLVSLLCPRSRRQRGEPCAR